MVVSWWIVAFLRSVVTDIIQSSHGSDKYEEHTNTKSVIGILDRLAIRSCICACAVTCKHTRV